MWGDFFFKTFLLLPLEVNLLCSVQTDQNVSSASSKGWVALFSCTPMLPILVRGG